MDGTSRRVIGTSLLCFLAALLVFLLYSIITFEPKLVLPAFFWPWTWNQSLIYLIEALIPVQCTALLLYYSLANPRSKAARRGDRYEHFYRMVNGVLVTLLVFALLFTVLSEGVRPSLIAKRREMLSLTSLAHLYYSSYQSYQREGVYQEAASYLERYLAVNPTDRAAANQLDKVKLDAAAAQRRTSPPAAPSPSAPGVARYRDESAQSLVAIARSYLENTDYASAHYYAGLALAIAPNDTEAKAISDRSRQDLSRVTVSPAEREQQYYFSLETEGAAELAKGNALDAYYLFRSLAASLPKNPDVTGYLSRATGELTQYAFFRDEVEKAASYPGVKDVLFVNRRDATGTEIVLLRKMVTLVSGTFVEGVDVIAFSPGGKVLYEIQAPYGKMIGDRLSMYCIGRTKPVRYLPDVIAGSFPDSRRWQLPLAAGAGTLEEIASFKEAALTDGMPRLWSLAGSLPRYGYPPEALRFEFLRRVMIPFGFLILAIFSIGAGWSLRPPGKRPSLLAFVLVPLLPYIIYLFESFYLFSGKILFAFFTTVAGFWPALVGLLAVQFLLVILSLVYLAGRSTER